MLPHELSMTRQVSQGEIRPTMREGLPSAVGDGKRGVVTATVAGRLRTGKARRNQWRVGKQTAT
eukprot:1647831-Pleurochrysis_carterae.AAC.1